MIDYYDILLDESGAPVVKDGDFVLVKSFQQECSRLLKVPKAGARNDVFLQSDIAKYINGNLNKEELKNSLTLLFLRDKKELKSIDFKQDKEKLNFSINAVPKL